MQASSFFAILSCRISRGMCIVGIPTESNAANNEWDAIKGVLADLEMKSANGNYIYRGETKHHADVSSSLYRDIPAALHGLIDMYELQEANLEEAKRFTFETDEFAILTELQHYGGKTNLIDFTADFLIALFSHAMEIIAKMAE